jgi:hypothetical protein
LSDGLLEGGVSGPGEVSWRKALRLNELAVGGRVSIGAKITRSKVEFASLSEAPVCQIFGMAPDLC